LTILSWSFQPHTGFQLFSFSSLSGRSGKYCILLANLDHCKLLAISFNEILSNHKSWSFVLTLWFSASSHKQIILWEWQNVTRSAKRALIAFPNSWVWLIITSNGLTYHLQISSVNSTMLGIYSDHISGWYVYHNESYGLPSTCNWKGYKTPFRRSGHKYQYYFASLVALKIIFFSTTMHYHTPSF